MNTQLHTTGNVQRTTYNVQRTTYNVQRTTYNVQRTTILKRSKITTWLLMMYFLTGSFFKVFSQGNNWKLDGNNNGSSTTFLGTVNSAPLIFKTNNQTRFTISNNGTFAFHTLSGNGNALMLLNNNGEAYRLNFSQNSNDVLTAKGSWQSINTLVPQYWQLTNAGLYTTQHVVVNNTITATGIQILHKIEADTIKGIRKVDINGNITLGEDGAYKGITAIMEDLNINSKPGYDFNTILNANTNGNVGIGTSNPIKKLDVNGDARVSGILLSPQISSSLINTETIRLSRISHQQGDSVIYIGDSTLLINTAQNSIKWTAAVAVSLNQTDIIYPNGAPSQKRGLSIGNGSTLANGINSIALGLNVATGINAHHAVIIGSGPNVQPAVFTNNIPNSLMIGFNSNIPTLFVSPANGIYTTGNVGIATTNPQAKLHINHEHTAIRFERSGFKTYDFRQVSNQGLTIVKQENNQNVMHFADTGNVGVNTVSPIARMHINGNFAATDVGFAYFAFSSTSPSSQLAYTNLFNNNRGMMLHNGASTSWDFLNCINDNGQQFKVKGNGKVYAREFLVTLENPFPDYVFEENYNLRSIEEVAEYIKQHKHLPGIISAKQLEYDNKVAIGELQRQMLEKMEEMMLYIIELKNENKQLKAKLEGNSYEKN